MAYNDSVMGDSGVVRIPLNSATITWTLGTLGGFSGSVVATLPFDLPGGITETGGRTFVASGLHGASGSGKVVRLHLTSPSAPSPAINIDEVLDCGSGIDPQQVYWSANDSRLYLLDRVAGRILQAPYTGADAALPAINSFALAAMLTDPVENGMILSAPPNGETTGVALFERDATDYVYVFYAGTSWVKQDKTRTSNEPTPPVLCWNVDSSSLVATTGPLRIHGLVGDYNVIDQLTGAVVTSGTTADPDALHQVVLPEGGLMPGRRYSVIRPTDPDGGALRAASFFPHVRHGIPTATTQARLFPGQCHEVVVGDADFFLSDVVSWQPGYSTPISADVYLWVAFRDESGADPVIPQGTTGVYILDPTKLAGTAGPEHVNVVNTTHGTFLFPLPIADDPNLAGLVVLFQYLAVVPPNGQIIVSDVFGTMIEPSQAQSLAAISEKLMESRRKGGIRPTQSMREAGMSWMNRGALGKTAAKVAECQTLYARFLAQRKR